MTEYDPIPTASYLFNEVVLRTLKSPEGEIMYCAPDLFTAFGLKFKQQFYNRFDKTSGYVRYPIVYDKGRICHVTFVDVHNVFRVLYNSKAPRAKEFREWFLRTFTGTRKAADNYAPAISAPVQPVQETHGMTDKELLAQAYILAVRIVKQQRTALELAEKSLKDGLADIETVANLVGEL